MYQERRDSVTKTWNERLMPLRDYFRQTDLHGYKYLSESNRILLERVIWSGVLLGFMFGSIYTITFSLTNFLEAPTAISEVPTKRKVDEIPFPAVAVCMANRFSKRRVMEYAEFVYKNQNGSQFSAGDSVEKVFESLKPMVHLIDFSSPQDDTELFKLHSIMRHIYNGSYPIDTILRDLQVPCEDILLFCAWLDMPVNCSEVFQFRRTSAGQCCIFNYIRPTIAEFNVAYNNKVAAFVKTPLYARTNSTVRFKGLSIVIDYTPDDDVITLTNTFDTSVTFTSTTTEITLKPQTELCDKHLSGWELKLTFNFFQNMSADHLNSEVSTTISGIACLMMKLNYFTKVTTHTEKEF
uniref:CSON006868 protein n=1 Tax=Culicoides sonorensis TaxID=179676 RepID=A0A336M8W7_CULSO